MAYAEDGGGVKDEQSEKEELAQVFFRPFFALTADDLVRVLSAYERGGDAPVLPGAIVPTALLNREEWRGAALEAVTGRFSLPELRVLNGFYRTRLGGAIIEATRRTKNDAAASYQRELAALTRDFGAAEQREAAPFLDDFRNLKRKADGIGGVIHRAGKAHAAAKLEMFYRDKRFTRRDSNLCLFFHKREFEFYALPICDAGLAAGDYESTLAVAEQYRGGWAAERPRDVERAKAVLRGILGRDRGGKAHFRLGLLTKNSPGAEDTAAQSVCYLRTAAILGYKPAREVLKGFPAEELRTSCVDQ